MYIEWMIQKVHTGKWKDLESFEKKIVPLENKVGFPPKKRLQGTFGASDETLIIERQWESLAQMEECYSKLMKEPELLEFGDELYGFIDSTRIDIYTVLP